MGVEIWNVAGHWTEIGTMLTEELSLRFKITIDPPQSVSFVVKKSSFVQRKFYFYFSGLKTCFFEQTGSFRDEKYSRTSPNSILALR